jgi:biofilm protein TabA
MQAALMQCAAAQGTMCFHPIQELLMIVDIIDNWKKYYPNNALWQQAFDYLLSLNEDTPPCEMQSLVGDQVKGRVMCYTTCAPEDTVLEGHDLYVDIQMSVTGTECIDWFPRSQLTIKTPYDPASDALFFERPDFGPVRVLNRPGFFTVLFPQDVHATQVWENARPVEVKKAVVKILLSAL